MRLTVDGRKCEFSKSPHCSYMRPWHRFWRGPQMSRKTRTLVSPAFVRRRAIRSGFARVVCGLSPLRRGIISNPPRGKVACDVCDWRMGGEPSICL